VYLSNLDYYYWRWLPVQVPKVALRAGEGGRHSWHNLHQSTSIVATHASTTKRSPCAEELTRPPDDIRGAMHDQTQETLETSHQSELSAEELWWVLLGWAVRWLLKNFRELQDALLSFATVRRAALRALAPVTVRQAVVHAVQKVPACASSTVTDRSCR
jgi:hypothetical protein